MLLSVERSMPSNADIARFAEKWANEGKVVIIAALDGTFQRRPFATV